MVNYNIIQLLQHFVMEFIIYYLRVCRYVIYIIYIYAHYRLNRSFIITLLPLYKLDSVPGQSEAMELAGSQLYGGCTENKPVVIVHNTVILWG